MSIEVLHLSKSFGQSLAISDLSFDLKMGQITGFLGPNGAGKSTVPKSVSMALYGDDGAIKGERLTISEMVNRKAKMWDSLLDIYCKISKEAEVDFKVLFNECFSAAYSEQIEILKHDRN